MNKKLFAFLTIFSLLISSISCLDKVTIKGTNFMVKSKKIFMNGVNTPWDKWNDFGGDYNEQFWDDHFKKLSENGINSSRVWVSCNRFHVKIDSNGIFIVFDLSNKRSFEDIDSWLDEINNSDVDSNTCVKMLIGNKLDTEKREIDNDTANKFAEENNMKYLDVSAKDGINIVTMFEMMGSECIKILQDLEKSGRKNSQGNLKLEQSGKKEEPKEKVKKIKKNIKNHGKCC